MGPVEKGSKFCACVLCSDGLRHGTARYDTVQYSYRELVRLSGCDATKIAQRGTTAAVRSLQTGWQATHHLVQGDRVDLVVFTSPMGGGTQHHGRGGPTRVKAHTQRSTTAVQYRPFIISGGGTPKLRYVVLFLAERRVRCTSATKHQYMQTIPCNPWTTTLQRDRTGEVAGRPRPKLKKVRESQCNLPTAVNFEPCIRLIEGTTPVPCPRQTRRPQAHLLARVSS